MCVFSMVSVGPGIVCRYHPESGWLLWSSSRPILFWPYVISRSTSKSVLQLWPLKHCNKYPCLKKNDVNVYIFIGLFVHWMKTPGPSGRWTSTRHWSESPLVIPWCCALSSRARRLCSNSNLWQCNRRHSVDHEVTTLLRWASRTFGWSTQCLRATAPWWWSMADGD